MPRTEDPWFYPPSRPIAAKGGIRATRQRGAFAESWWGRRWIEVLESFDIGTRLGRGRTYARKGQVLDLAVEVGRVTAKVQGSRPKPYAVSIALKPLAPKDWDKVTAAVAADTWSAARLVAGELPDTVEAAFRAAGVPLFPARLGDLKTDCSCPDWSNPCKHVAAVYYLLAEAFDTDPFLLFRLRGSSREAFLAALGPSGAETPAATEEAPPPQTLSTDPAAFWQGGPVPPDLFAAPDPAASAPAVMHSLGAIPFWRGDGDAVAALTGIIADAARQDTFARGGVDGIG